jgi:hypothetical protein
MTHLSYLSNPNHYLSCRHPLRFFHLLSCVLQPSTLVSASHGSFRTYSIAASPCLLMSSHCRRSAIQPSHVRSTHNIFCLTRSISTRLRCRITHRSRFGSSMSRLQTFVIGSTRRCHPRTDERTSAAHRLRVHANWIGSSITTIR